ncbi:MAG: hypothetical protein PHR35_03010 [Kiritimatiellae bacterium]|nr:hypothetical protein [Kiritimatiellia bacterium]
MTKAHIAAMLSIMTGAAQVVWALRVDLEPCERKRQTVTIPYGPGSWTEALWLYAPDTWRIGESHIIAQDDAFWIPYSTLANSECHIYLMVDAYSSQQYVSIYGHLVRSGAGKGTPPWFRVTVPSVDVDWYDRTGPEHEPGEETWVGICPMTTNNSQRTKLIVQIPKDDYILLTPSLTLFCSPPESVRFLKADGVTAIWSGATIASHETPLLLYVDPQTNGEFVVSLVGSPDDYGDSPSDYLKGVGLKVEMEFQNSKMQIAGQWKVVDPFTPATAQIGVIPGDMIKFHARLTPSVTLAATDYLWEEPETGTGTGPDFAVSTSPGVGAWYPVKLTVLSSTTREREIRAVHVGLTDDVSWGLLHPNRVFVSPTVYELRDEALAWASANETALGGGIHNGRADAARHAYWNAIMTADWNVSDAEGLAEAHERSNIDNGEPHNESAMDMENNAVGRTLPSGSPTRAQLQTAVENALDAGALSILDCLPNVNEVGLIKPSNQ